MKKHNRQTGNLGEELAAQHLMAKGYEILQRNFSNRFGEIDVIVRDGDTLVFVEVKTKIGSEFGSPEDMISKGKLQRVRNMATLFMNGKTQACRLDVIAIVLTPDRQLLRLTHYENVY